MTELEAAANKVQRAFKVALAERGMTQVELARLLGTGKVQLNRALNGNTSPKDIELQKQAAKVLGIEI